MGIDSINKYHNYCISKHDTYPFISPTTANLHGRYVLVTGASKGIGHATALSFARAGASGIAILARSSLDAVASEIAEVAKEAGHPAPRIVTAAADVADAAQVSAASEKVKEAFGGKLDVLVLNAGVLEPIKRIVDQDPKVWWATHEASTLGAFVCLHFFIPLLRSTPNGLGTVVGTSSVSAMFAMPGFSALPSAKLALSRMMENVNAEYGPEASHDPMAAMLGFPKEEEATPLLAYSIHPGMVDHPDRTDMPAVMHEMSVDSAVLAGDATVWLVKERREWLAGRFLSVNWDMEDLLTKKAEIEKRDLLKFRLAMDDEN